MPATSPPAPTGAPCSPAAREVVRLFFALWPDDLVRDALAHYATAAQQIAGGRAMRPETLHLTLAFLGDTPVARLPALIDAAERVTARQFALVLDLVAWWKHNRIVWAGASVMPESLRTMVGELRERVAAAGFRFDPKPFVAHATLLRNATPHGALPELAPIEWTGDGFVLVRSTLSAHGSRYETIGTWPAP